MFFLALLRAILLLRAALAVENLALRQQVAVLKRNTSRPRVRLRDLFVPKTPGAALVGWRGEGW